MKVTTLPNCETRSNNSPLFLLLLHRNTTREREETLESALKAITDGRAPLLALHLKKLDTWETCPSHHLIGGVGGLVEQPGGSSRHSLCVLCANNGKTLFLQLLHGLTVQQWHKRV